LGDQTRTNAGENCMAKRKATKPPRKRKAKKSAIENYLAPKKILKSTKEDIKQFRKAVSTLKRLGLAFTHTSGRTAKPTSRGKKLVKQFEGVLSGKEKAYKVGKKKVKEFAKINIKGAGERIILPVHENEKITTRKGSVFRKTTIGNTEIRGEIIPVGFEDLKEYLDNLVNSDMKPAKGKDFAFRIGGSRSYRTFQNLHQLVKEFDHYISIQMALAGNRKQQQEILENLEIIQVSPATYHGGPINGIAGGWSKNPLKNRSEYSQTYYDRLKRREPTRYKAKLEKAKAKSKANYEATKSDPEKLAKLRQKERERYARSKNK
jgi:hypothetical protein